MFVRREKVSIPTTTTAILHQKPLAENDCILACLVSRRPAGKRILEYFTSNCVVFIPVSQDTRGRNRSSSLRL